MSLKGDFISFTYNGVHSTDLGIVHVSMSNRYTDNLLPTIQDKTVQVPGGNGTYFFGSYYTQRPITIDVAFDNVSEAQIRLMRKTFGDGKSHPLTFDEEPYKVYYAKVNGTPNIKFVPFDSEAAMASRTHDNQGNLVQTVHERVYKGEGTFTFVCYDPFAHCPSAYKKLASWVYGSTPTPSWYRINNKTEWNPSAGLRDNSSQDVYNTTNKRYLVYNPGDIETDFYLNLPLDGYINTLAEIKVTNSNTGYNQTLVLKKNFAVKGTDNQIRFNTKLNLIEGMLNGVLSGNIYNECISNGNWPKIPVNSTGTTYLTLTNYTGTPNNLEYDYLYY